MHRPRPRFNDYFPPEERLIILERKSPQEEEQQQKSVKLYNDIAAASDGLLKVDSKPSSNTLAYFKRKGARLGLTDLGKQQTPESYNFDFVKQIATAVQATIDDTIGTPPTKQEKLLKKSGKNISLSTRYNTYYVSRDGITLPLVLCTTYNKGLALEEDLFSNFENQINTELEPGGLLEALLIKFKLVNRYKDVEIKFNPGKSEKRPIGTSDEHVTDVGEQIADYTFVDTKTKKEFYISLKDVGGKTFANKGVAGVFKEKRTTESETNEQKITIVPGGSTVLDDYFSSLTGDKDEIKDRICRGLEEYAQGVIENSNQPITTDQYYFENIPISSKFKTFVQTTIKSGLGYGYYYLKEKKKTEYIFIDLTTKDKLDTFVKDYLQIVNVSMQFPYYIGTGRNMSSKSFNLYINTKNGSTYNIEVRSKGGFVPSEFLLSVTKFEANPQDKKDMILSVVPSALTARSASKPTKNK